MEIILKYFPELTEHQRSQFAQLQALYTEWNEKINVISRKDIDQLYLHHVLHSLALVKVQNFKDGQRVLDVGTGGGFPGIPLAIYYPGIHFHLVDSIGKKLKVVQAIAKDLGLQNITTEHNRVERLRGKYDYIVSRAVAPTLQLYRWTQHLIKETDHGGWLLLKGGNLEDELKPIKRFHAVHALNSFFKEPFFETKKVVQIL